MNRFAKISIRSLVIFTVLSGLVLPAGAQETGAAPPGSSSENALVVEAKTLLDSIQQNMAEIAQLREESDQAQGEERVLLERRRLRKGIETLTDVDALVKNVLAQEEQGLDAAVFRKAAEDLVGMLAPIVRERVARSFSQGFLGPRGDGESLFGIALGS